jgi:hypothetical protein
MAMDISMAFSGWSTSQVLVSSAVIVDDDGLGTAETLAE